MYPVFSQRKAREDRIEAIHPLLHNEWSPWITLMVPKVTGLQLDQVQKRPNGFILVNNYKTSIHNYADGCGIYEWRAKRNKEVAVVYIGSTCTNKSESLRRRVREYCMTGSHKGDFINEALRMGYKLEVRMKPASTKEEAEQLENQLLDKYDYAWNERCNGIRKILRTSGGSGKRRHSR